MVRQATILCEALSPNSSCLMMMGFTVKGVMNVLLTLMILVTQATIGLSFGSSSSSGDAVCIESEKEALLSFKRDLVDPSNKLSSWDVSIDNCCKWVGVVCNNSTGHVQELHLANTRKNEFDNIVDDAGALKGKLNPWLLSLKDLSHLDLSYNDFGGIQIPSFFGSLQSLTYLNLTRAGFKGIIPPKLGNLSSLHALVLHGDYDYDLQARKLYADNLHWLSSLSSLQHLDMSFVNLSKASDHWLPVINKLSSLSELHLFFCELSHFPNSVFHFNLTSLSILDLEGNHFDSTTLPSWLFNLKSLVYLDLSGNRFECPVPYGIKNLTALKHLDLFGNDFNSTIPSSLYRLPKLEYLDINANNLEGGISSEIGNMTSLVHLDLSGNSLEGKLPTSLGNLCNLKHIGLGGNKFGGNISDAFESLSSSCLSSSLRWMYLNINSFFGHLTDQILEFRNLESLNVAGNNLSGLIPEAMGKLSALQELDVGGNRLSGSLPESLGDLSNLNFLYINSNFFEGVVAEAHFANLTNLKYFFAYGNSLSLSVSPDWNPHFHLRAIDLRSWKLGPRFPMWLKTQYNFIYMDLSNTQIADSIPSWFWNLSFHIYYLNLSHNQISGTTPDGIFDTSSDYLAIYLGSNKFNGPVPRISSSVTELDLSNNSFSGDIFHFLCHPSNTTNRLEILRLGDNLLTGKIPDCWMNWTSLKAIHLGNNNFTGEIPDSMGYLQRLQSLHLRNNNLSGEIPPSLQNCLLGLDIGLNEFIGSIPKWIGTSLSNIMVLGLRANKFDGHIPFELCNLASLQILDVANNNLSGTIPICFKDLKAMTTRQESSDPITYSFYLGVFMENAFVVRKGRVDHYDTILALLCSIDLSDNNLSGEIPLQLTSLQGLLSLNLSGNHLKGNIPDNLGNITWLESLDLSRNQLSGKIPNSLSKLTFLSYLNLSYNNLSGRIPLSTQLQSFDLSSFVGGNQLCGPPVSKDCNVEETAPNSGNEVHAENEEEEWFHVGIATGFAVGFLGVIVPLLLYKPWRYAYYWFLEYLWYKILDCFSHFVKMMS